MGTHSGVSEWRRVPDWPDRLAAYIERVRREPFCWGRHDCALFVAGVVHAMTGRDIAAAWRGPYGSALSAARMIRRITGAYPLADGINAYTQAQGWRERQPTTAQRGDVVLLRASAKNRQALGVCVGATACAPGPIGLVFVALGDCQRAWSITCQS